jgi:hypothetical protein
VTEDKAPTDVAVAWIEALTARGVMLAAQGSRGLTMRPKQAYGEMSVEERRTLKRYKAAILDVLRARYSGTAGPPVQVAASSSDGAAPTLAPAPQSAPCPHCYQRPCCGEQHELYDLLHPLAERQLYERTKAEFDKDLHAVEMRRRFGLPDVSWL